MAVSQAEKLTFLPSGAALQCQRGCWCPQQNYSNSPDYKAFTVLQLFKDLTPQMGWGDDGF